MKKQNIYFLLAGFGVLNAVTGNLSGILLANFLGPVGLAVGEIITGLTIPFLLLGWYFSRKSKIPNTKPESKLSKYTFYIILSLFSLLMVYTFIQGILISIQN